MIWVLHFGKWGISVNLFLAQHLFFIFICIFILFSISIHDLADFVANVEPTPLPQDIAKYPIPREHHLNFLKPGIKLVLINMSSFNMQIFTYFMVHVVLFQFQI